MKNEERDELLKKIDNIKNNNYDHCEDADIDYKDKYSKDIEYMSLELDYELDRIRKRRAY